VQIVSVYLKPFRRKAFLKCALQTKIHEKFTKNPILGVQGRSKSSMLINLISPSPVLVMISSMSIPICRRFHTKRANIGKISSFKGVLSLTLSFKENLYPGARNFVAIN